MPQAIPVALAAIKTAGAYLSAASAATAAGTATLGQTLAVTAANLAVSATLTVAASALQPAVRTSGTAIDWTADPNAPLHFAFGRVGLAGQIVHCETFGPDLMYAAFVSVFSAAGPIDGFVSYSSNDQAVTFDANGKAITSEYANEMFRKTQIGSQPTATALSIAGLKNGATLPNWGSAYKLNAKAAEILILAENSKFTAFDRQVPKGITVMRGLLCWDPRLDSTYPGGSGSCRLNDPSTWVYTTNAYLHALKWALGLWEGPTGYGTPQVDYQVGGIGALPDEIDVAAYVEAANLFDANEWACAAWPGTDEDKAAVLDSFLQAGGAIYAEKRGLLSCVHRIAERASVATITGADTTGPIELDAGAAEESRINTVQPRYWSEAHKWQMVAADPVTSTTWQEEDGQGVAVERSRGLDFNYVPTAKQVRELAALQIAHTREGIRGVIPLRPYMQGLEVGDCITIDEPDFVLDGLKCLILDIDDETDADTLRVAFIAESDGKYGFAYGLTTTPPPAPSLTPESNTVATPDVSEWALAADLLAVDGADVPALVLTGEVDNARATAVVFEYRVDGAPNWTLAGTEEPNVTRKVITGVSTGQSYEVAVRYRVGARISDRLVLGPVGVGDTTPPGPVTSGTVTGRLGAIVSRWTNPTDSDFDLAKVYRHTSNDRASATLIGSTRGTQFADDAATPLTDFHVWVSTVDRTGNEQDQADWAYLGSAQASDPGDLVTVDDYSWDDLPGRPTELTDGRVVDALEADGTLTAGARSGSGLMLRSAGSEEFTGDADATAGADWSSNLTNRPTELTDGRIAAGLASNGDLARNIPISILNGSNVLRFTGGGAFTGALNANYVTATSELTDDANLGETAAWTGVSGRPTDLSELDASASSKLAGVEAGAQVNPADLAALDAAAATKLAGIESGAQVNPANLAALDATAASDLAAAKAGVDGLGDLAVKNTVATADIDDNSVISIDPFEFSGTVTTSGATSDATAVTVMEFEVESDGEPLLIRTELVAKFWHPSAGDFSFTLRFQRVGEAGTLRNDLVINGINGDQFHGFLAPTILDVPGSGTHTYKVFAWASTNTGFTHRDFTDRFATVTHLKATTLA